MARVKTTEDAVQQTANLDAFKQAIIDVGLKMCDDISAGRERNPLDSLAAICNLYNAIK